MNGVLNLKYEVNGGGFKNLLPYFVIHKNLYTFNGKKEN